MLILYEEYIKIDIVTSRRELNKKVVKVLIVTSSFGHRGTSSLASTRDYYKYSKKVYYQIIEDEMF